MNQYFHQSATIWSNRRPQALATLTRSGSQRNSAANHLGSLTLLATPAVRLGHEVSRLVTHGAKFAGSWNMRCMTPSIT
jgi:hypothetical protein